MTIYKRSTHINGEANTHILGIYYNIYIKSYYFINVNKYNEKKSLNVENSFMDERLFYIYNI